MSKKKPKIKDHQLEGFKYFKAISKMLEGLHHAGCDRDIAGNRILHMDQYVSLVLLYMFNPICTSLRSLQQVSELKKVQKQFGAARASLGSLSEASTVFDSDLFLPKKWAEDNRVLFWRKHAIGNTRDGRYFFFSKGIATAIIAPVVAGDRAMLPEQPEHGDNLYWIGAA